MDADHSRPSGLPTKLRWRPYSNGTSIKSKRAKKETQQQQLEERSTTREKKPQDINPKALAHKVRGGKPHYVGKAPSNEVQLQWEEAETIESMSAGGHPHNQHIQHHHSQHIQPQNSHQPNISKEGKASQGHGSSTLPSPPMARLALVGGESDLGQYKASVPVLTGDSLGQGSMSLSSILGNSSKNHSYHLALTALLENHRSQMRLSQMATPSSPSLTSSTSATSQPSPINRKMSSSELLGISTIDELLESCGYVDDNLAPTNFLASPATTNQSLHSSPDTALLESPGSLFGNTSFSTTRNQLSPAFAQNGLVQDLSSPFAYLSSNRDPLLNNVPTAWPSLFPLEGSDRDSPTQHVEMATQEQSKQYLTPTSGISTHSSPLSQGDDTEWFGYLDESSPLFDDRSLPMPVFDQDIPSNKVPGTTTSATQDEESNKTIWNWAEEMLRPAALAPTGHRGFPSTGPMARTSQFGGGGLVRTLQSNYQQKSGYHTKAAPRTLGPVPKDTATSTTSAASIVAAAVRGKPVAKAKTLNKDKDKEAVAKKEVGTSKIEKGASSPKHVDKDPDPSIKSKTVVANGVAARKEVKDAESYSGLLAMFRGLWQGTNEGGKGRS
ncbi:hypothetical protein BGZ93_005547 [Podila epicladia]|nr:hypothetical protein BGZ92_001281 [Podila epicladia]KAG0095711.1 hypothetical protein BGZ93_005547 [Podila epicladia]